MSAGLWEPAAHSFPVEQLDGFLLWAVEAGASDIALQTGAPGFVEIDGRLARATSAVLDRTGMEVLVQSLFNETGMGVLSVLAVSDGAVIGLFDGFSVPIRTRPGRVSDGRRRVKPLRGSFASLRPFG